MTNEALLEEWNNAEPVAVPPADDIIARWEKATPIDWKPGHFIPTRRNWAAMRESFAGDPLAFVLDPKLRADFEFVTAREKDPELTRKKLALANYYANMRRERVLFAYDNLDSFIKQFHGKELSADAAYNEVAKLLTPQQSMAEGGEYWKSVGKAGGAKVAKSVTNAGWSLLKQFMIGAEMQALADPLTPKSYEAAQETMNRVGNVEKVIEKQRGESVGYYGDVAQENTAAILKDDWFTSSEGIADWCTNAFTAVLVEAPNMGAQVALSIAAPQAAPFLLGGIYANDKYFDLSDEHPEMSDSDKAINAALTGVINGALDKISVGILTGKGVKPELVKQGMAKAIRYSLASIGKEGGVEAAQQLAENSVDIMTGVYGDFHKLSWEERGKLLLKGVPESFLVGAVYGAPYAGIGYMNARQRERLRVDGQAFLEQRRAEIMAKETVTQQDLVELQECNNLLEAANPDAVIRLGAAVNFNEQLQPQAEVADPDQEMSVEELAQQAEQQYWIRTKALVHNPADTADRVRELAALYPGVNTEVVDDPAMFSDAARAEAARREIDLDNVRGFYDPATNTMVVNAARVRPSEVPALALHEIVGHAGLKQVLGNAYDQMLDGVIRDHRDDLGTIPLRYNLDLDTVKGQREAAEEYIAHIAESNPDLKPSWWREFLQQIKMLLRRVPGLENLRYTDREIEAMLARSARAMRRSGKVPPPDARANALRGRADGEAGDGQVRTGTEAEMRFAVNENGETLFGVAGRDGNLTARQIIDDPSIRPDEPVLTSDGSDVWGEITPEMAAAAPELGLEALPIKLLKGMHRGNHAGFGLVHMYEEHGAELEARGYDLVEYLAGIFSRPNQIYASSQEKNIRLELVTKSKPRNIGVLELRKEDGFYSVITAFPMDWERSKVRGKLIWQYSVPKYNPASSEPDPLEPLSADKAASAARMSGTKSDPNITDSGEKSSTSDDDGIRFSIAPVWTGSAAAYDRPSLHYIGTGEGAQAYGWGLYGSSDRGIATGYAERDVKNKFKQPSMKINGETFTQGNSAALTGKEEWFGVLLQHLYSVNGNRKQAAKNIRDGIRRLRNLAKSETDGKELEFYQAMISDLKRAADFLADEGNTVEYDGGRNIYKQTFWPDKEENLLDWDEPVPPEQMQQIADQAVKEQLPFGYTEDGKNFFNGSGTSGKLLYKDLAKSFNLGSPKAVSEFLYRAGIDGITYIGDTSGVRNYVAFSDQDIRVDEHLRFSVSEYSDQDMETFATILRPFVGLAMDKTDAEYLAYLQEKNLPVHSEEWAHAFAAMAEQMNQEAQTRADKEKKFNWLYENIPFYRYAVDAAGTRDFKIVPSYRYMGEEFKGVFIAEAWRKFSGKEKAEGKTGARRKKKLEEAAGVRSDALAETIARDIGGDAIQIENDLIEFFRNLNRNELERPYRNFVADSRFQNNVLERQAREEFEAQQRADEINREVERIIESGELITEKYRKEHPEVVRALRERLLGESPKKYTNNRELEAINAAIKGANGDPAYYAKAYQEAKERAWQEYAERFRKLRERVMANKADALALQREAADFAAKHIPKENRGEFTRAILRLLEYSTIPNAKYPEGRRKAEFDKLLGGILRRGNELRRKQLAAEISKAVHAARAKRIYKGIPTSLLPTRQEEVNRIIRILDASELELDAMQAENVKAMMNEETPEEQRLLLAERNREIERWRRLEQKSEEELGELLDYVEKMIAGGKEEFRDKIKERAAELNRVRQAVKKTVTDGRAIDKDSKADAKRFWGITLKNRAFLKSFLKITAGRQGTDELFDQTEQGRMARAIDDANQKETTMLRKAGEEFHAAQERILGVKGVRGRGKFVKQLNLQEKKSGVFVRHYIAERDGIRIKGERPAVSHDTSSYIARRILKDVRDKVPLEGYVEVPKDARDDFAAAISPYGRYFGSTDQIFLSNGELRIYHRNRDNTVEPFTAPLDALPPGSRILKQDPYLENDLARQLADYDAGLEVTRNDLGDDNYNAAATMAARERNSEGKIQMLFPAESDFEDVELTLSRGEAMQLLLEWEQPDFHDTMEWNGWSDQSIAQLKKFLGPELVEFAYWMRGSLAGFRERLDRVSFEKYGVHLPDNPLYFPGAFKGLAGLKINEEGGFGRLAGQMSMNPSFLIARRWHRKAPDTNVSALETYFNHIYEQAHFLAWNDIIGEMRGVFNDKDVKTAMDSHLGKAFTRELLARIGTLAAGGRKSDDNFSKIVRKFYRNWMPAKIMFSIPTAIKQYAGVLSYMNNVPVSDFIRYFGEAARLSGDFRAFAKWAKNTDYIKNRLGGALDRDLIHLLGAGDDGEQYSALTQAGIDLGTLMNRQADARASIWGGFAVYKYHRVKAERDGFSRREAHEIARRKWMEATEETQQSGFLSNQNSFQTSAGAARYFTAFMSNPIQTMDLMFQAVDEIRFTGLNRKTAEKLARRIVVNHLMIPTAMFLVGQAWRHGFDLEEYEWEDWAIGCLFGSFEGYIFASYARDAVSTIVNQLTGKRRWNQKDSPIPAIDEAMKLSESIEKLADGAPTAEDIAQAVKSFGDAAIAAGALDNRVGQAGAIISALAMRSKQILRWFNNDN
jgi:hypothetical protein